jgi:hypothetical protein
MLVHGDLMHTAHSAQCSEWARRYRSLARHLITISVFAAMAVYFVRDGGPGDPMNIVLRGNNLAGQIPEEIGMLNNSLVIL